MLANHTWLSAVWFGTNGLALLRHSNVRTTLRIYSHAVDANKRAAQEHYLNTLLSNETVH
jgi:integrase